MSPAHRQLAASRVRELLTRGVAPVIVVSAFGRSGDPYATDTLLGLPHHSRPGVPPRELAMIAGCGEIIATVVTASAFREAGLRAEVLTGAQAGIRTAHGYVESVILSVDPAGIVRSLDRGCIPVVAGFQGTTRNGETATLKRGGSDISCTALGFALDARGVDIYTDVPGIMTADPRIVPGARLIETLSFEHALALACHGAKVIHPDALRWAIRGGFPVRICSLSDPARQTLIGIERPTARYDSGFIGVACQGGAGGAAVVTAVAAGAVDEREIRGAVETALAAARVPFYSVRVLEDGLTVTAPEGQMAEVARAVHAVCIENATPALDIETPLVA